MTGRWYGLCLGIGVRAEDFALGLAEGSRRHDEADRGMVEAGTST